MANLSADALAWLAGKWYSQFQIDTISKAAQAGWAAAAQKAISDIGSAGWAGTSIPATATTPKPVSTTPAQIISTPAIVPATTAIKPSTSTPTDIRGKVDTSMPTWAQSLGWSTSPMKTQVPNTSIAPSPVVANAVTPWAGKWITAEALAWLTAKWYTPDEVFAIKNAASTWGLSAAQAVIKGIGTKNAQSVAPPKEWAVAAPDQSPIAPVVNADGTSVSSMAGRKNIPWSTIKPEVSSDTMVQWTDLTSQTAEQLAKTKQDALIAQKDQEIKDAQDKLTKWLAVISANSAALGSLYGIKPDGSIDQSNPNGLAFKLNAQLDNFRTEKNNLLSGQESAQLNQAQWTMRSLLASRWYTSSNVPPEVLIWLSGQVGIDTLSNIGKIRTDTVNAILQEEKNTNAQISAMQEKGVIDANQARTASETLRSQVEDLKNNIDKQFKSDVLGVATAEVARKQTQKESTLNAVTKLGSSLGLQWSQMAAVTSYLSGFSDPNQAVDQMFKDLSNPNSALAKQVWKADAARIAANTNAAMLAQAKLLTQQANLARYTAAEQKATTWPAPSKFTAAQQFALGQAIPWKTIASVADLTDVWNTLTPAQQQKAQQTIDKSGIQF